MQRSAASDACPPMLSRDAQVSSPTREQHRDLQRYIPRGGAQSSSIHCLIAIPIIAFVIV
jgi:hypothetical protein